MKTIRDATFDRTKVVMDDTDFVNCKITNCEIVYSGGKFGWTNTDMANCQIALIGPAALTVSFLEKFALIHPEESRWQAVVLELPRPEETVQ